MDTIAGLDSFSRLWHHMGNLVHQRHSHGVMNLEERGLKAIIILRSLEFELLVLTFRLRSEQAIPFFGKL